ncbi:MAG: hypothetical protein KKD01_20260, partial [Proteobacteria bacterium]|nr:hypothetical protein [Pseudomonadota bacterium]
LMPDINDRTTVTLDLKWLILLGGMLLSAGGMGWQLKTLADEVRDLKAQAHELERRSIEIAVTLKAKKVID